MGFMTTVQPTFCFFFGGGVLLVPAILSNSKAVITHATFSHLKMDGEKMILSFWGSAQLGRCELLVSGSVPFTPLPDH